MVRNEETRLGKGKHCLSPLEIEAKLKAAGVQPTAQRIAISRFLLCEADHCTADEVKKWADANFPKVSLATVYNTLGALVKAGLMREYRFPHSEKVVYDCRLEDHFHFLDEETGKLIDLAADQVTVIPKLGKGFELSSVEVVIRGRKLGGAR